MAANVIYSSFFYLVSKRLSAHYEACINFVNVLTLFIAEKTCFGKKWLYLVYTIEE